MTTTTTRYAYDGWNPAKAGATGTSNFDAWAVFNSLGSLTSRQLQGDGIDQHLAYVQSSNAYWYLTDHLGSTRAAIDNSGAVQDSLIYDAYGNITYQTPSPSTSPFYSWDGYEYDAMSSLYRDRARVYDSASGRWTTQDPMGFDAGDSNLYRYVNNTPTNLIDPSGLADEAIFSEILVKPPNSVKKWKQVTMNVFVSATAGLDNEQVRVTLMEVADWYVKAPLKIVIDWKVVRVDSKVSKAKLTDFDTTTGGATDNWIQSTPPYNATPAIFFVKTFVGPEKGIRAFTRISRSFVQLTPDRPLTLPFTTAHEMAHGFGLTANAAGADALGHIDQKNNLMTPNGPDGKENRNRPESLADAVLTSDQIFSLVGNANGLGGSGSFVWVTNPNFVAPKAPPPPSSGDPLADALGKRFKELGWTYKNGRYYDSDGRRIYPLGGGGRQ